MDIGDIKGVYGVMGLLSTVNGLLAVGKTMAYIYH